MLKMNFLDKTGNPVIKKKYREITFFSNDQTYRVNMYFTLNYACPCNCHFCRNKELSKDDATHNLERQKEQLRKWSQYIDTITIGGGEPLIQVPTIISLLSEGYLNSNNVAIVTSGIRKQFLSEVENSGSYFPRSLFDEVSTIYLSRLKKDDTDNQKMFNTRTPILTGSDIMHLPNKILDKITILSTCCLSGISSLGEMLDFINWVKSIGVKSVIFNDLQKSVSGDSYKDNISEQIFADCIKALGNCGFYQKSFICYSSGYDISSYTDGVITVGFKHYHIDKRETKRIWRQRARKRTYDLALLPNGDFLPDHV